jgi:hypothetical protein
MVLDVGLNYKHAAYNKPVETFQLRRLVFLCPDDAQIAPKSKMHPLINEIANKKTIAR